MEGGLIMDGWAVLVVVNFVLAMALNVVIVALLWRALASKVKQ